MAADGILKLLIALSALLLGLVQADDSDNRFIKPQRDSSLPLGHPVLKMGDIQTVEWETNLVISNLTIWQENIAPDPKGATVGPVIFGMIITRPLLDGKKKLKKSNQIKTNDECNDPRLVKINAG